MLLQEQTFYLVQSTLGWLSRHISKQFNESAARQYLRRCIDDDNDSQNLEVALGESYKARYDVFLLYIEPSQLENIQVCQVGPNGEVYKAVWNRPVSIDCKQQKKVNVALKRVRQSFDVPEKLAVEIFLKEVLFSFPARPSLGCFKRLINWRRWKLSIGH